MPVLRVTERQARLIAASTELHARCLEAGGLDEHLEMLLELSLIQQLCEFELAESAALDALARQQEHRA